MKNRNYQRSATITDMLGRIIDDASKGNLAAAKSTSDMVAVQTQKQKSFGKSAIPDAAYDPRSSVARAKYQGVESANVAQSGLTHCNDEDYGPPTSAEHKLTEWIESEVASALAKGLPAVVAARRCAARILDKNAKRYSTFHRDAVHAMNELLLRLDPQAKQLLTMNQAFLAVSMPSDQETETEDDGDDAPDSETESVQHETHTETVEPSPDTNVVKSEFDAPTETAHEPEVDESDIVTGISSDSDAVESSTESFTDLDSDTELS